MGMPNRRLAGLCVLVGGVSIALWVALTVRADSPLGRVGAAILLATGLVLLLSAWSLVLQGRGPRPGPPPQAVAYEGESAVFYQRYGGPRRLIGLAIPAVLGCWALAMAVTGLVQGQWAWAVLLAVPILFLLALPVLSLAGRLGPGGVWVTPSRVIDDQGGLRTEIDLRDAFAVRVAAGSVQITGARGAVREQASAPSGMRRRSGVDGVLTIDTDGLAHDELVAALQARVPQGRKA